MLVNKQFNTLIVEGPESELKHQFMQKLHDTFNGRFLVVTHGDIYEQVYAMKNNLVSIRHTHGAQVKYILFDISDGTEECDKELSIYKKVMHTLPSNEFDVMNIVHRDSIDKIVNDVSFRLDMEFRHDDNESDFNEFNKMYSNGCKKFGLKWHVIDNQPYLYNRQIMADYQYHNGSYETYDDKTIPDTLLYSAAYTNTKSLRREDFMKKKYDIQYPINSKIKYRTDAKEYIKETVKSLTLYTSKSSYIDEVVFDCTEEEKNRIFTFDKVFCDDYIKELSHAKATVITNREFAHTEMMTARWYEAVIANCVIFVDELTDPQHKVLKQIYGNYSKFVEMLTVTPETFVDKVKQVLNMPEQHQCIEEILNAQHAWYNILLNNIDTTRISTLCR